MGIPEDIARFEQDLGELIIKYEQYFLGLEKREPLKLLQTVEKSSRKYTPANIVNTMHRFRYNALIARFNSYRQHWNRIVRLIEEGKYSRDQFKMKLHQQGGDNGRHHPQEPEGTPEAERLYQQYIEARKACHLPTGTITLDLIASTIAKQKPLLTEKYHCEQVEFKVVIEDGKPKIKARPKR
ncbi:MAG TPA: MXAN_5187 C-terminal domain-containing protein [Geomobilimonas sp.]|nr:MXAN_5187 C-terminal domain-containing protein [Geomobilimonas sp.]